MNWATDGTPSLTHALTHARTLARSLAQSPSINDWEINQLTKWMTPGWLRMQAIINQNVKENEFLLSRSPDMFFYFHSVFRA